MLLEQRIVAGKKDLNAPLIGGETRPGRPGALETAVFDIVRVEAARGIRCSRSIVDLEEGSGSAYERAIE